MKQTSASPSRKVRMPRVIALAVGAMLFAGGCTVSMDVPTPGVHIGVQPGHHHGHHRGHSAVDVERDMRTAAVAAETAGTSGTN